MGVCGIPAVVPQQRLECVSTVAWVDHSRIAACREMRTGADVRPRGPGDCRRRQILRAPPLREGVEPTVSGCVRGLPRRTKERRDRRETAKPVELLLQRRLMQMPGAFRLGCPIPM